MGGWLEWRLLEETAGGRPSEASLSTCGESAVCVGTQKTAFRSFESTVDGQVSNDENNFVLPVQS